MQFIENLVKKDIIFHITNNPLIILFIFACILKRFKYMERKYNRIKVVLAEKDKTGMWLSDRIGKSNATHRIKVY